MGQIFRYVIGLVLWRLYDGRGYRLSEIIGWFLALAAGALVFGLAVPWQQMVYGGGMGIVAVWCMVKGYNGWDQYLPMFRRSLPALLMFPWGFVCQEGLGADVNFLTLTIVVILCFAANVTEVPIRRWQHRMDAKWGGKPKSEIPLPARFTAHIAEGWEAVIIAIALALLNVWHQGIHFNFIPFL